LKRSAEVAANGVHSATSFLTRNESNLADGAQVATQQLGSGLEGFGKAVASGSNQASQILHSNASRLADASEQAIVGNGDASRLRKGVGFTAWTLTKVVAHTVGLAADVVAVTAKITAAAGRAAGDVAPVVGGAVGGAVRGAAEMTSNAMDAAALPASSIETMRSELRHFGQVEMQRAEQLSQKIRSAQRGRRKTELLDLLVVGGITLSQAIRDPNGVPDEIERAFDLAYPGLTQTESFSDAVNRMSSEELTGLVSGVKGKLFEIELVNHLNNGGLPEGFRAAIAESATQPGWDIQIADADGQISELLQAKATESVGYVQDALERYPNIDVTTTTEVHGQLLAMGLAQEVRDSGISESVLQAKVEAATHGGSAFDASDLVPSSIGLAVIALSVFMNKGTSLREKGTLFGNRSARAGMSSAVGKMAMVVTQTWWLGLIAGVGSSWLANRGHGKREQYEALKQALELAKSRHLQLVETAVQNPHERYV
jgi:hypothetical protein